jgi:hypothetical protein
MGGACSKNGGKRKAQKLLVRKSEEKRPLGRPTRRWVDNVQMDLEEIECGGVDCIVVLAQDRYNWRALVNAVMRVP